MKKLTVVEIFIGYNYLARSFVPETKFNQRSIIRTPRIRTCFKSSSITRLPSRTASPVIWRWCCHWIRSAFELGTEWSGRLHRPRCFCKHTSPFGLKVATKVAYLTPTVVKKIVEILLEIRNDQDFIEIYMPLFLNQFFF